MVLPGRVVLPGDPDTRILNTAVINPERVNHDHMRRHDTIDHVFGAVLLITATLITCEVGSKVLTHREKN